MLLRVLGCCKVSCCANVCLQCPKAPIFANNTADDDKKQPPDLYKRNSFCVFALFDIYTISKKSNTKTVG